LRRFIVQDTSMRPALEPGDRLVVLQWSPVRQGDIVVFIEPDRPRTVSVKRVRSVENGVLDVRGDNVNVSRDSREFGRVPRKLVFGRAIYRYLPGSRRGRL
jgi:nickel-type superoxide dismutase maturation protease